MKFINNMILKNEIKKVWYNKYANDILNVSNISISVDEDRVDITLNFCSNLSCGSMEIKYFRNESSPLYNIHCDMPHSDLTNIMSFAKEIQNDLIK